MSADDLTAVEVSCSFRERITIAVADDPYLFVYIDFDGPFGDGHLRTFHPPAVGDRFHGGQVNAPNGWAEMGEFRVIDRRWSWAQYGSQNWPYGPRPSTGPLLELICERTEGLFAGEADVPDDDEDEGE